jgi:hypothetical protein
MFRHSAALIGLMAGLALAPLAPAPGLPATTLAAQAADPPVPQTFDWWVEDGIPATTPWGQAVDTAATRQVLSWTTGAEFTNPLVNHLPLDPQVVSPADHWGYPSGRPGHLHRVDELYGYYEALAASSPRVNFQLLGETEEGNRFALVQVGSEENLARLDEIRDAYQRLTDPRRTSREEMEDLVADLPVIHMVYSGLHSPETGHAEVTPELAYRVAVSDDPMIQRIREEAILFIVPVVEPDGRNRVVDWYRRHAQDIYDYDDRVPGPPFWGAYVRHDNNRDGLALTLALSRQMVELAEEWKHPIALDLHESVPFLYVSTGTGPYNPNVDPIARHEWQWISQYEVTSLTALGMPGVWTHDFYDGWNPSYIFWIANNRNAIGRFYETFGNSIPQTVERTVGGDRTSVEWFRANPPYAEVTWSIRNNINYAQSGVLHSLHLAATNRTQILRNYWTKNHNAVQAGRTQAPHAYHVPVDQARRADVGRMLNLLRHHGVEVHRADVEGTPGGHRIREGDLLIRMDQPYRNFVKNLMETQEFPEDAPRPYDDVAWTFPLLYNLTVEEVEDPEVLELAMTPVTEEIRLSGTVRTAGSGTSAWWVARYAASSQSLMARFALGDAPVFAARSPVAVPGGEPFAAGAWLIPADQVDRSRIEDWAESFGLEVVGVEDGVVADIPRHRQELPRIALLHSWRNTQDDGSVRYIFDSSGIPYTYFPEHRLREGNLREQFDVILFPEQGRGSNAQEIFQGVPPDHGPLSYARHPDFPSLGYPVETEDITGGMGYEGLAALRVFVEEGGTLIALGSAATLPADFGLVRGVSLRDMGSVFVPGSIVMARVTNREHPLTYGYDDEVPVMHRFGPYFSVDRRLEGSVVLRYAGAEELFRSGLALGREELADQPALLSVPMGEGHVVLSGIRLLHRNHTQGSFAFAWNAILNWNHLDVGVDAPVVAVEEDGSRDR